MAIFKLSLISKTLKCFKTCKLHVRKQLTRDVIWAKYDEISRQSYHYRYLQELALKDIRAHCYYASLLRTQIHTPGMHRTRLLSNTMNNDREDATAFHGLNDLGRSVNPTFLSRNIFYLQYSTRCPNMNKNSTWKVKKKNQDFCPRDIESCHVATASCVKRWSLNLNLFFKEPHQLTKFT